MGMSMSIEQKARDLLASVHLRQTRPRAAILGVLLRGERPMTQDQIAEALGAGAPNKVTIYRVLETLVRLDVVHKAFLQERTWHYEAAHRCSERQCHPHFTCTVCGRTHCMTEVTVPMAQGAPKGFVIEHQRVQLEGLCPACSGQ